ncbi:reprolysin-like metallopeptidase [Stagnimonas aquatica]|uniref:reprolysin-like metallopeptidase n=1 Tax=Stagnimonas aquatica TaxID=2689987 RepID=UPI0013152400|nr:zinc-dependent metalloprotease family protein [Stagnimonas aquatica]
MIVPRVARSFAIDYSGLRSQLATAPAEGRASSTVISLPMPDGRSQRFRMVETAVMAPGLAARYPEIRTYAGSSLDEPGTTGRFDIGPRGLHGMIFSPQGQIFIDPHSRGETANYLSYFKRDLPRRAGFPADQLLAEPAQIAARRAKGAAWASKAASKGVSIAGELRTYRLAFAADGEYSRFHDPDGNLTTLGPDKAKVLAEIVNVVNRVTSVYERELGIRLQLVENEDRIIFTSRILDPYADRFGLEMLAVNTAVISTLIGNANYDVGHVASTGGGGVAGLGVVCSFTGKGQGVTGLSEPVGDGYYIDYVAHEMGHQFGANHTFNSETGACGGGNRNAGTAYEPGSGVTIMAYAGICGDDDLAPHSIDTFHAASFDEIVAYTRDDTGNDCAVISPTANHAPEVSTGEGGFSIPKQTPFELTGSATDADGDALTYQWEQFDLGAAGSPDLPDATAPLFRSFPPTASPTRVFPQPSDLLSGSHTIGERLPDGPRDLNFRLIVRDNRVATSHGGSAETPEAGGVASADLVFHVVDAGPFQLTEANGGGSYKTGMSLPVTWDVAGTDLAPISCSSVDLLLSTDGGQSFPITLLRATANDGSEAITLPADSASETARLKVKCHDNVFFDISDADFAIAKSTDSPPGTPGKPSDGSSGGGWPLLASLLFLAGAGLRRRVRRR